MGGVDDEVQQSEREQKTGCDHHADRRPGSGSTAAGSRVRTVLVPYDPSWPNQFDAAAEEIQKLGGKSGPLSEHDRQVAQALLDDLQNAMGG